MADLPQTGSDNSASNPDTEIGEGSYAGTRDYNERTKKFLEKNGDQVDDLAQQAADALDGSEGDDLRQAEAEGKAHAKK